MKQEIAGRLRRALENRGRSIRSLQQQLNQMGIAGSSYPNVHAYFAGRTQPSIAFLAAAGTALEVNPEWLAFNKGYMTDADAIAERGTDVPEIDGNVLDALRESFPAIGRRTSGAALSAAWRTWNHVCDSDAQKRGRSGDFIETARRVGDAMQAPLSALGVKHRDLSEWQLGVYAALVSQALMVVSVVPKMLRSPPR
jgi:hypothetical protein